MVVVGGLYGIGYLNTVEIYDVSTGKWRSGTNPYPRTILGATGVQYGDTFIVVGGAVGALEETEHVYRFEPDTEGWTLMPERLPGPMKHVGAFVVSPEEFPECP